MEPTVSAIASRSDKDLWPEHDPADPHSTSPTLPVTSSTPSRTSRRRWVKRITSLPGVGRTIRGVRWVIGPSTPVPDERLPRPHPSLSVSLSLGSRSWRSALDEPLVRFRHRARLRYLLWPFLALWATMFVLLIRQQYYIPGPSVIACNAGMWDNWPPDVCGVNATDCEEFLEGGTYRCMGGCLDVTLGNPRWVGGEEVNGVPYVVGGSDRRYRADSWVCPAAIQSGLISRHLGGCVAVKPTSTKLDFAQSGFIGLDANGVKSVSFEPSFPGAFELFSNGTGGCLDIHPIITGVNAACLLLVTLSLAPAPAILFALILILGYLQIVLVSDPPNQPPYWERVLGGLPAALMAGYFFWRVSFKRTLEAFQHLPVEVALWQGIGFWIGIESSTIFSKLPIQRLGYGPLPAGGVITIIVIVIIVAIIVLVQAWQARKYGLLQYYIVRHIVLVPILIVLAFIPNYTLRLHHYLLATIAIPVLSLPNRVSLFGQAFALGLFLDGVGRWGWASILEYTASLVGDAVSGTGTPAFMANMSSSENISWFPLTPGLFDVDYQGVSVIVDDVLRAGNITGYSYSFADLNLTSGIDHFFRLAFQLDGQTQDYSDPIALYQNGSWADLAET